MENKLTASELRLDNLILVYKSNWNEKGTIATMQWVEEIVTVNLLASIQQNLFETKPIPLTKEWLLKFGFKEEHKIGNQNNFILYSLNGFTYNTNHGWWFGKHLKVQPKYVHQLQNLYFALTNEELIIK